MAGNIGRFIDTIFWDKWPRPWRGQGWLPRISEHKIPTGRIHVFGGLKFARPPTHPPIRQNPLTFLVIIIMINIYGWEYWRVYKILGQMATLWHSITTDGPQYASGCPCMMFPLLKQGSVLASFPGHTE